MGYLDDKSLVSAVDTKMELLETLRTVTEGKIYVDGSLLYAEWQLARCCARRGWAFAAVDRNGTVIAAAKGRPPSWCSGIH